MNEIFVNGVDLTQCSNYALVSLGIYLIYLVFCYFYRDNPAPIPMPKNYPLTPTLLAYFKDDGVSTKTLSLCPSDPINHKEQQLQRNQDKKIILAGNSKIIDVNKNLVDKVVNVYEP